jgi:hypothetical protein
MRGGGTKGHAPSTTRTICVVASTTIRNDIALAPRGQNLKRSGAMCVMHDSLGIFVRPTTSSSTTMRPTAASGWRTTASRARRAGRTMTSSSSNLSPSTWPTHPKLGSILTQKLDRLLGGSQGDLHQQLSRHIRAARHPLGFEGLLAKAGGIPVGLRLVLLPKVS